MRIEPDGPYLALSPSEARLVRSALYTVKHGQWNDREFFLRTGDDLDAVSDLLDEIDSHESFWQADR
jgi:hypothetical protein